MVCVIQILTYLKGYIYYIPLSYSITSLFWNLLYSSIMLHNHVIFDRYVKFVTVICDITLNPNL